ncbi:MAG: hypothetical protein LC749_18540, partial [Actinobacteria bacterium]|nr:hypothetical protein [Actinomycetota bacterium]
PNRWESTTTRSADQVGGAPTDRPRGQHEERPHLKEFVGYIWGSDPPPAPDYQTDLTAVVTTGLTLPGTMDIAYYAPRMPFGKLYIYPDYLVFLTESHNKPGAVPGFSGVLPVLLDAWRAVMFWRPIPVVREVYRRVTTQQRDRLRRPLGNPNSLIVPLSEVRGVTTHRWVFMRYAVLHTVDREIMLAPNLYLGVLSGFTLIFLLMPGVRRSLAGGLGLPWETQLVAMLEQAARDSDNKTMAGAHRDGASADSSH